MNRFYKLLINHIVSLAFATTLVIVISCGSESPNKTTKAKASLPKIDLTLTGEELYAKNCKLCHGINGKLKLNGAKDLHESTMTLAERKVLIKEGKNAMTPFKKLLSDEEIKKVAEYSMTFSQSK